MGTENLAAKVETLREKRAALEAQLQSEPLKEQIAQVSEELVAAEHAAAAERNAARAVELAKMQPDLDKACAAVVKAGLTLAAALCEMYELRARARRFGGDLPNGYKGTELPVALRQVLDRWAELKISADAEKAGRRLRNFSIAQ